MKKRELKDLLYGQVARIGKAISSPKRLELLGLLSQSEKTVEMLASELSADIKLVSAHLKALREARLVTPRRDGKNVVYSLSGDDVAHLMVALRQVAEQHLLELQQALNQIAVSPEHLAPVNRKELLAQARRGEVILLDVRPSTEYAVAHLPHARSMPLAEIKQRLSELPTDKEIVAYCRGPFCLFSEEAAKLLASRGYRVRKFPDGVSEWQAAGFKIEAGSASA